MSGHACLLMEQSKIFQDIITIIVRSQKIDFLSYLCLTGGLNLCFSLLKDAKHIGFLLHEINSHHHEEYIVLHAKQGKN